MEILNGRKSRNQKWETGEQLLTTQFFGFIWPIVQITDLPPPFN